MFAGMNTGVAPSLAPHHMALIPPERLAEIQKEYYNRLRQIDKETRKFRHDIQNHVQLQLMIFINTE